jgi:hypothetical protein
VTLVSRPRAIALLAAAAVACPLTGCGKGGNPGRSTARANNPGQTTATTPSGTRATPGKPLPANPLSPSRARAFADAVNLTAADLPGFARSTRAREGESASERDLDRKLARCTGGQLQEGAKDTEHASGQFRRRGNAFDQSVGSSITFLRAVAAAAPELQALRSARTRDCLRVYLNERFSGRSFGGAAIRRVTVRQGTPPAPGTAGGFGWRIVALVELRRLRVPFYLDILGFIRGQAEVALTSSALLMPFPAEREERLYRLLLARATAHKL